MASTGSQWFANAGGGGGYAVGNSAMFDKANTEYFTDTPGAGDQQKWTVSFWVKMCDLTTRQIFFGQGASYISINENAQPSNRIYLYIAGSSPVWNWETNATDGLFRDPTAWYNIVVSFDSTNGTADHRLRLYVNGVEFTDFLKSSTGNQNSSQSIGGSSEISIGKNPENTNNPFDGYMAEMVYIDGTQHTPTSFGEFDEYGVWKPKDVSGLTFGTKGWYLNFASSGSDLGDDASGNGFDFTNNNTVTQSGDSPTKNFATISSIDKNSGIALANGNLNYTAASTWTAAGITQAPTQKTYWEFRPTSNDLQVGVNNVPSKAKAGTSTYYTGSGVVLWQHNSYWNGGTNITGKTAWSSGDVCAVAFDPATGKIWFAVNNTWNDSGNPATGSNASVTLAEGVSPGYEFVLGGESGSMVLNFGQDDTFGGTETSQGNSDGNGNGAFHYAPPSGFLALTAMSIAEPSVPDGSAHHQAILWSGNSATQVVSQAGNSGFTPDWAIIKSRSFANGANSFDVVRGSTKGLATFDNGAEDTNSDGVAFSLNGNVLRYEDTTLASSGGSDQGNAIDTNPATQWSEGSAATGAGATFTITFTGNARHIRRLKIQTASGNNVATGQKLQYSLDGSNFVDAGSYTVVANNSIQAFNFNASASANIWRLITTTAVGNPYSWAINQLEMYEHQDGVTDGKGNLGFTGAGNTGDINNSGRTYVGLTWKAGGSASTNEVGSIDSSVSVNTTAGISVGTYTGNGSNGATLGHGLGIVPRMVWCKKRDGGDPNQWAVYSAIAGEDYYMYLDAEGARVDNSSYWNDTAPTSTVFTLGTTADVNGSSTNYVFYAMADVAGYQKIGAYTGNGSADGPMIHTGFKPQYVMIKSTTQGSTNWEFFCDEIEPNNVVGDQNFFNIANAEANNDHKMDWLATGFKIRDSSGSINTGSGTFLYWAIAKYPFGGTCPAPAR